MKTEWRTVCEIIDESVKPALGTCDTYGIGDIDTDAVPGEFHLEERCDCGGAHWHGPWCTRARVYPGGDMTFTAAIEEALKRLHGRRSQWHRMLQD